MAPELTLRVITPERVLLDTPVSSVVVPATDGLMGILPRHAAMVAALDAGKLTYKEDGQEVELFIAGGFAEVRDNTVRILAAAGESPADIDAGRAKAAEERARARLSPEKRRKGEDVDLIRAEAALHRAVMRLRVSGRG
jgi:F-type H+-transporting ATPase subunit epsilon